MLKFYDFKTISGIIFGHFRTKSLKLQQIRAISKYYLRDIIKASHNIMELLKSLSNTYIIALLNL